MRKSIYLAAIFFCATLLLCQFNNLVAGTPEVRQWTHFRGSHLDGRSSELGFPVHWNDTTNIDWKITIPGNGWSSPVVYGDQIWCTTATDDGYALWAVCIDFDSGAIIHQIKLFEPDTVYPIHAVNSHATPTPCIEDGFVYVHFGRYGTACIDTRTGEKVWERTDLICEHGTGPASSPILFEDMLILHMEGTDVQFVTALDKTSGQTAWRTDRNPLFYSEMIPNRRKASCTPLVIHVNGRDLLISSGSVVCNAFDIYTGEEVWHLVEGDDTTIPMPVTLNGLIAYYTGFVTMPDGEKYGELIALDPDGKGDIEETHIHWRIKTPMLQIVSPVVSDGLIFTVDANSRLLCIDASNGETIWSNRLIGKYNSSLILAGGLIYINSSRGETKVVKAGPAFELVSENSLKGQIWATPAFTDKAIIMRTAYYLYKISQSIVK